MALADLDPQSLSLAIELQLRDLDHLVDDDGNVVCAEEGSDFALALRLYKNELVAQQQVLSDQSMCHRIAEGAEPDAVPAPAQEVQQEEPVHDEPPTIALPILLRPRNNATEGPESQQEKIATDGTEDIYGAGDNDSKTGPSASEAKAPGPRTKNSEDAIITLSPCLICCDRFQASDLVRCPCSHDYCRGCLETLFRTAMTDESLFPPRCCARPIPVDCGGGFLSQNIVTEFEAKRIEFGTVNRTYCYQPTCSAFIPPSSILADLAYCTRCTSRTCSICKAQAHVGECPKDESAQEMLRIIAEKGWQRCYSCHRVVDLVQGCNHMTCLCRAEFCYVCGKKWKSCTCGTWDEARIIDRANAIVDRQPVVPQVRREVLVERALHNLQANHECGHRNWRRLWGAYRCDECRHRLPEYIFECTRCNIMACRRCRFNRLQ